MEIARTWYRTDACGRQHGPYRTIILDQDEWDEKAKDLAARFVKNFSKYTTNAAGEALVAAGPQL